MSPRWRVLPVAGCLAVLTACGSGGDPTPDSTESDGPVSTPEQGAVAADFEAHLGLGPLHDPEPVAEVQGLVAEYTITNNGDEAILVADEAPTDLPAAGPSPQPPEGTWVFATDSGVRLSRQVFALADPSADLSTAYTIGAQRLAPGESLTGRAFAALPLREVAPHTGEFDVPELRDWSETATTWHFCVQVRPDTFDNGDSVIRHFDADAELLCSESADLPSDWFRD